MEMKIGARIAGFRRERGLTQEQLAEMLGVSAPAVSKPDASEGSGGGTVCFAAAVSEMPDCN